MIEPGKYSFYVGKRPQIAHCQLQQYYDTAAIAFMRFAVFDGIKTVLTITHLLDYIYSSNFQFLF